MDIVAESNQSLGCLKAFCSKYPVEQGIVATVIDLSEKVLADLAALPFPLLWLNHQTPLPVVNLYETPETLGYDRMAAVVGANEQFPHRDILVIDAGTCITYEFIDSKVSIMAVIFLPAYRCASGPCTIIRRRFPCVNPVRTRRFWGVRPSRRSGRA